MESERLVSLFSGAGRFGPRNRVAPSDGSCDRALHDAVQDFGRRLRAACLVITPPVRTQRPLSTFEHLNVKVWDLNREAGAREIDDAVLWPLENSDERARERIGTIPITFRGQRNRKASPRSTPRLNIAARDSSELRPSNMRLNHSGDLLADVPGGKTPRYFPWLQQMKAERSTE